MQPTIPQPNMEQRPNQPVTPQFNATPLGGVAANLAPSNPNIMPSAPNMAPNAPEIAPLGSPEQLPNPETQIGPGQSGSIATPAPTMPLPPPIVVQSTVVTTDDSASSTSNPTTAADEDLIEKEWVTKAKTVIAKTKDDPHAQAQQIAELMRDYVKKRYGKEVGKAPDDL